MVTPFANVASAEELSFVPLDLGASGNPVEGFYGANYTPNVIKAGVSEFAGMQGDIIVTGETTHEVSRVHWNSGTSMFEVTNIGAFPNQPEDGLFVTTTIINVPEPSSLVLALMAIGVAGSGQSATARSFRQQRLVIAGRATSWESLCKRRIPRDCQVANGRLMSPIPRFLNTPALRNVGIPPI